LIYSLVCVDCELFLNLWNFAIGYSCHDISSVCKDAAMAPLRECGYDIVGIERERLRPFKLSDFINSLQKIRPSVAPEECKAYEEWNQKFGNSSFWASLFPSLPPLLPFTNLTEHNSHFHQHSVNLHLWKYGI
jgi:hypothetical protein